LAAITTNDRVSTFFPVHMRFGAQRNPQPAGVLLEGPSSKPRQGVGLLEAQPSFKGRPHHARGKMSSDARVLVVVEVAAAGRFHKPNDVDGEEARRPGRHPWASLIWRVFLKDVLHARSVHSQK